MALLCFVLTNRHGSYVGFDGWAYWEGGASLIQGKGYTYFTGHPIVAFPPLYSLYLALWMIPLGATGKALIIANGVLIVAQAAAWFLLSSELADSVDGDSLSVQVLVAAYIGIVVPVYQYATIAHNLFYLLLPLQIIFTWRAVNQDRVRGALCESLVAEAASILYILTHNSGVIFVLVASAALLCFSRIGLVPRVCLALVGTLLPISAWEIVHIFLHQQNAHPIILSVLRQALVSRGGEMLNGVKEMIFPHATPLWLAALVVGIAAALIRRQAHHRRGLLFAAFCSSLALLLLVTTFAMTPIGNRLEGRFVLFVPLLIIPVIFRVLDRAKAFRLLIAIAALTIPMLAARSVKWTFFLQYPSAVEQGHVGDGLVPLRAQLSRLPGRDSTLVIDGRLLIAPMPYEEPRGGPPMEPWGCCS